MSRKNLSLISGTQTRKVAAPTPPPPTTTPPPPTNGPDNGSLGSGGGGHGGGDGDSNDQPSLLKATNLFLPLLRFLDLPRRRWSLRIDDGGLLSTVRPGMMKWHF